MTATSQREQRIDSETSMGCMSSQRHQRHRQIRLKKLPPASTGEVRYTNTNPYGRFLFEKRGRSKVSKPGSWTLTDMATGAVETFWSLGEAVRLAERLSDRHGPETERMLVVPKPRDAFDGTDCVLYDLVTGKWWPRARGAELLADMAVMQSLGYYLPERYFSRWKVRIPPKPGDWCKPEPEPLASLSVLQ